MTTPTKPALPEPVALIDPRALARGAASMHCISRPEYRSAADVDVGVEYVPVYTQAAIDAAVGDLQFGYDFYKRRCDALQAWQSRMRDPERIVVCDILANGFTLDPPGKRYDIPDAAVAEARAETEALKSDIADALATIAVYEAEARAVPDTLCQQLQQQCSDWGVYWRASDAHGVNLSLEQAHELLRFALGVEVEIAATPSPAEQTRSQKLAAAGFTRRPSLWAMQAREALELIAAPRRPDGSWNRDREACRQIAAVALGRHDDEPAANPAPVEREWIGSIPAEESDAEFAAQIARMDAKPAPVERVPLTEAQIEAISLRITSLRGRERDVAFARDVEAEHGIGVVKP